MSEQQAVRSIIAVAGSEVVKWGCPYCGYRSGATRISGGGCALVVCGECEQGYVVMADGVEVSSIGLGNGEFPELEAHPRVGISSHGKPDVRPETGGEYFYSRGIGSEWGPCFMCELPKSSENAPLRNNIAAFVSCKAAGERVVAMFTHGAYMDYREMEPDRVQVKICACEEHLPQLRQLDDLCQDNVITQERVAQALVFTV